MKPKTIALGPFERVVSVVPEYVSGPGWTNAPVWVHVEDSQTRRLRTECIQPDERTPELHALFDVGASAVAALLRAVPTIEAK